MCMHVYGVWCVMYGMHVVYAYVYACVCAVCACTDVACAYVHTCGACVWYVRTYVMCGVCALMCTHVCGAYVVCVCVLMHTHPGTLMVRIIWPNISGEEKAGGPGQS